MVDLLTGDDDLEEESMDYGALLLSDRISGCHVRLNGGIVTALVFTKGGAPLILDEILVIPRNTQVYLSERRSLVKRWLRHAPWLHLVFRLGVFLQSCSLD